MQIDAFSQKPNPLIFDIFFDALDKIEEFAETALWHDTALPTYLYYLLFLKAFKVEK